MTKDELIKWIQAAIVADLQFNPDSPFSSVDYIEDDTDDTYLAVVVTSDGNESASYFVEVQYA